MVLNTHLISKNRKALYNHQIIEKYTAGLLLKGYEVKAIREGKANFEGSYVQIIGGVPSVVNMYIGPYSKQSKSFSDVDARKTRPLLLNKKETGKITIDLTQKGKTAVPLALVASHGLIKLEFAVVKGLKEFEKKVVAKERQIKKDLEVESKEYRRTES
jgi:SsrA-binding protein